MVIQSLYKIKSVKGSYKVKRRERKGKLVGKTKGRKKGKG